MGRLPIPDLDDPVVLERHLDFIKRLGERYDGHPDIDHVDLGSVGWWGEWHMSGSKNRQDAQRWRTAKEDRRCLPGRLQEDAPGDAHRRRRDAQVRHEHGAGWRADCLGDMGGFSKTWCHMRKAYPTGSTEAGAMDAWKTAPVAWETCWDMRKWVQEGWSLRYIFNYALALHGSYINNKSAPLPSGPEVRPEIERFLRRLGYRLVLKELKHPAQVQGRRQAGSSMKWQNIGSAPCYRPYRLAYRLTNCGRRPTKVIVGDADRESVAAGLRQAVHRGVFQRARRTCRRGRFTTCRT